MSDLPKPPGPDADAPRGDEPATSPRPDPGASPPPAGVPPRDQIGLFERERRGKRPSEGSGESPRGEDPPDRPSDASETPSFASPSPLSFAPDPTPQTSAGVRLEESAPGIATLIFGVPDKNVNILSSDVLMRFRDLVRAIRSSTQFRGVLVRSALPGTFIVGADVNEIAEVDDVVVGRQASELGQAIFQELADLPIPVVAAINGTCLGGGTELALACHYRVASTSDKVRIGLPEVRLGIVPGFGGTQRLPRLVGLPTALDMILTSRNLRGRQARRAGLIDALIPEAIFEHEAVRFAERAAAGAAPTPKLPPFPGPQKAQTRSAPRSARDRFLESPAGRKILYRQVKQRMDTNTKGFYLAPQRALEVVFAGWGKPLLEALALESEALGELVAGEEKKALVHVFFLTEQNRRVSGAPASVKPREIRRAGLLGAGLMGGGIARLLSHREIPVRMRDLNDEALLNGLQAAAKVFKHQVRRRRLTRAEANRRLALIKPTLDYSGFGKVDVVIEAVVEKMEVKQTVLHEVEAVTRNETIFASNTSALSITELAKASARPDRVAGLHFFNPVHRMPLVEIVRGEHTSDQTTATLMALARRLGKTPILCKDGPGFLVNRILGRYLNEAGHLLADGLTIERCDRIALEFGMPMGPVRLIDEIGIDVAAKVGVILSAELGTRYHANNLLERMVGEDLHGAAAGAGFYLPPGRDRLKRKRPERVNPRARNLIETGGRRYESADHEVLERLIYGMVDEAARCLDDAIVATPGDVDLGMIFGTGFPPFRGGLLRYADNIGVARITDALTRLAEHVEPRFAPCDRLKSMAARGESFYGTDWPRD